MLRIKFRIKLFFKKVHALRFYQRRLRKFFSFCKLKEISLQYYWKNPRGEKNPASYKCLPKKPTEPVIANDCNQL